MAALAGRQGNRVTSRSSAAIPLPCCNGDGPWNASERSPSLASALSSAVRWRWRSSRNMPLIGSSVSALAGRSRRGAAPGHHRRNRVGRAGCQSRRDLCCDAGGADTSHLRTAVAASRSTHHHHRRRQYQTGRHRCSAGCWPRSSTSLSRAIQRRHQTGASAAFATLYEARKVVPLRWRRNARRGGATHRHHAVADDRRYHPPTSAAEHDGVFAAVSHLPHLSRSRL